MKVTATISWEYEGGSKSSVQSISLTESDERYELSPQSLGELLANLLSGSYLNNSSACRVFEAALVESFEMILDDSADLHKAAADACEAALEGPS